MFLALRQTLKTCMLRLYVAFRFFVRSCNESGGMTDCMGPAYLDKVIIPCLKPTMEDPIILICVYDLDKMGICDRCARISRTPAPQHSKLVSML